MLNPVAHTREKLAKLLWSDSKTEVGRNNLRSSLSRLRPTFAEWLYTDRTIVRFQPNEHFIITRGQPEGLHISPQYNAWLYSLRYHNETYNKSYISTTAHNSVVEFCRQNVPPLILQRKGLSLFERHYCDIVRMYQSTRNPEDQYLLGMALYHYTLHTGCYSDVAMHLFQNAYPFSEACVGANLFRIIGLAQTFGYTIDINLIRQKAHDELSGSTDMIAKTCLAGIDMNYGLSIRHYEKAAEHSQVFMAYNMSIPTLYQVRSLVETARCCFLAYHWQSTREYTQLARTMAMSVGSTFLLPQIDQIQRRIDTHD